jgi:hypothetical protein
MVRMIKEGDKSKRGALQEQDSSDEEQFDYSACYESTSERRGNPKYPDLKVRESKRMRSRGDAGAIGAIRQNLKSKKRITELKETKKARYNKYEIVYYYDPKSTPPRYWAGEIKNIYLPGEFPNPADSPDIRYLICPGSDHGIKLHNTVVIEKDLRPLSWGGRRNHMLTIDHQCLFCGENLLAATPTKFVKGEIVQFFDTDIAQYRVGVISGRVRKELLANEQFVFYNVEPEGDSIEREADVMVLEKHITSFKWHHPLSARNDRDHTCLPTILTIEATHLHPLDHVGIDTCSALTVSTQRDDFLFIDSSEQAKASVTLRGIGGDQNAVGGRGPLVVSIMDEAGKMVFMIDPAGVFLDESSSSKLRILGQQRMKAFGFNLVQNKKGDGVDYLVYKDQKSFGELNIPLKTKGGILLLKTLKIEFTESQRREVILYARQINTGEIDDHLFHFKMQNVCPVLVMNEATLTTTEANRLNHWRHAHRSTSGARHSERCPACEQAKHKSGSFKRNKEFLGTGITSKVIYWRLYCDSYGGQRSMGDESYQGAKGGFVFVCPVSGTIKVKLYASTKQYPAILYQVLQEIEGEGYVCSKRNLCRYLFGEHFQSG